MARKRKVPLRKCIVTKEMKQKVDLIRIVRTREGEVFVDPSGKKNGRGAYLSKDSHVIDKAKKMNVLEQQFKTKIEPSIYEKLNELVSGQQNEK